MITVSFDGVAMQFRRIGRQRLIQDLFRESLARKVWLVWFLIGWLPIIPVGAAETPERTTGDLIQAELKGTPEQTRVLFTFKNPVRYTAFTLTGPDRLVIDLSPCLKRLPQVPELTQGAVQRLRSSQFSPDTVRVVLDLSHKVRYALSARKGDPFVLVVDLAEAPQEKKSAPGLRRETPKTPAQVRETARQDRRQASVQPPPKKESNPVQGNQKSPLPESEPRSGEASGLESGKALVIGKEYARGRDLLFQYLNTQPPDRLHLQVIDWLGQSYTLEGKERQWESLRDRLITALAERHGTAVVPELIDLAERTGRAGDVKGAIFILSQIRKAGPEAPIWKEKGRALLYQNLARDMDFWGRRGSHQEVIRRYLQHRKDIQESGDSRLALLAGNSYRALGFHEPALRLFQAAWQGGAQGDPQILLSWAETLAEKGDEASAIPLFRGLLASPDASPELKQQGYRALIHCLHRQRLHTEAYQTVKDAMTRYPRLGLDPEFRLLEGLTAFEIPNQGREALGALRTFLAQNQDAGKSAVAYEKMGDLLFEDKQLEEAWRAYYQAARLRSPGGSPFLVKKLTQCRLLVEAQKSGTTGKNEEIETDPFWKRLFETRFNQQQVENRAGLLRLN